MVWKCLQVELRAWRVEIVGADWKMWRRISLARSEMCMVAVWTKWSRRMIIALFCMFFGRFGAKNPLFYSLYRKFSSY